VVRTNFASGVVNSNHDESDLHAICVGGKARRVDHPWPPTCSQLRGFDAVTKFCLSAGAAVDNDVHWRRSACGAIPRRAKFPGDEFSIIRQRLPTAELMERVCDSPIGGHAAAVDHRRPRRAKTELRAG
jgi:hypothetical protein